MNLDDAQQLIDEQAAQIKRLREIVTGMAIRIAEQSEALARAAERDAPDPNAGRPASSSGVCPECGREVDP